MLIVAVFQLNHGGQVPLLFPSSTLSTPTSSFSGSSLVSFPTQKQNIARPKNIHWIESNSEPESEKQCQHPSAVSEVLNSVLNEDHEQLPTIIPSTYIAPAANSSLKDDMRVCSIRNAAVSALISIVTLGGLLHEFGTQKMTSESLEDRQWIRSSKSWVDRSTCSFFGICGASHYIYRSRWRTVGQDHLHGHKEIEDASDFWTSGLSDPKTWTDKEKVLRKVPRYVMDHAPYVHLFSKEEFWPSDMADHLVHTTPHLNYTPVTSKWKHPNLTSLGLLNKFGRHVFLKSNDNVEERPDWLGSSFNIPEEPKRPINEDEHFPGRHRHWSWPTDRKGSRPIDPEMGRWWRTGPPAPSSNAPIQDEDEMPGPYDEPNQELRNEPEQSAGGRSGAPAILVVVDKGKGVVDAFWFYFYSYNLGNKVFNIRFGNHIGDWEHTVIRFYKGKPKAIFFSEHDMGAAYSWEAVEKIGRRPVSYSGTGTHAMYADPGVHTYVLPFGLLHDITDRGPLWDPALNVYSFTYDYKNDTLRSSQLNPKAPTSWFFFWGHWGDKFYPLSDPRQYRFAGQYHYVNGPLGPRFKRLGRKTICQGGDDQECRLKHWIGDRGIARRWENMGEGEQHDLTDPEDRRLLEKRKLSS